MPKQRLQVDSGIAPAQLRPAAAPVDTFVRTNEGRQLEQLAQGLAQLSPALGRFSDVLAKRDAESDFAAGTKKARELAESAKSFRDAIRSGLITPDQSPWFMAGLREQFGRLAADRMNFDFLTAAAQDENLRTTTNPADFDSFSQNFHQQWQKDNLAEGDRDAQFEKGFGHKADAYAADAQRQFAAQLAGRVVRFAGDGHFSEVMNTVVGELGRNVTPAAIGQAITELNDAAVARGMGGDLVNRMTIDAVVAASKRLNDTSILSLLDSIQSGKANERGQRPALSSTGYGADQVEQAENAISSENQARNNREWQQQERNQAQAVETIVGEATKLLEGSRDPHNLDLRVLRDRMSQVAPEKVPLLYQLQDAWSDRTITDDPLQVASAFRRIYNPRDGEHATTIEDASTMLAHRQITRESWSALVNEIQQRDTTGGGGSMFERDPLLKESQSQLRRMFVSQFGFESPDMRRRAEEAVDEFTMRYIRWRRGSGKDANEVQAREFVHEARNEVFRGKASSADARDFDQIPQANLRPVPPDPAKMLVTDPSNIRLLQTELEQLTQRKRNSFSAQALSVLQYAGIPPVRKDIEEFLRLQNQFVPLFVPSDSTTQSTP